jgi:predicted GNAT superfamily acetyltransferase
MSVEIRHLQSPEEAGLAAELQRWVRGGDRTPAHVLLTAAQNGSLCAGAFVDGTLAGFVRGFLALEALFARGYAIVDFVRGPTFGCYILECGFNNGDTKCA